MVLSAIFIRIDLGACRSIQEQEWQSLASDASPKALSILSYNLGALLWITIRFYDQEPTIADENIVSVEQ